jgi:hypothetical protein
VNSRVGKHELLTLIVPFFGAAIVQLFHSQQAAIIQVMAAPLTESVKHDLINYQFGQGLVWIIGVMLSKFYNYYFNAIQAFAYFCAPSIVMVLAYGVSRGSLRDVGFLAAATFAPLAILGVAWDLSRMLCMTPFTALLSIYYMQSTKPETVVRGIKVESAVNIAVSLSSMLFILLPFVYAYFEVAAVIDRGFIRFDWTSIGEFVTHAVEDYSHKN